MKYLWYIWSGLLALLILILSATCAHAVDLDEINDSFVAAEADYGVPADLLIAIAALESGWGESWLAENRNNLFGWTSNAGEYMAFESVENCIDHVAGAIAGRPHSTVEEMAEWYNGPNAEVWADAVKEIRRMVTE